MTTEINTFEEEFVPRGRAWILLAQLALCFSRSCALSSGVDEVADNARALSGAGPDACAAADVQRDQGAQSDFPGRAHPP